MNNSIQGPSCMRAGKNYFKAGRKLIRHQLNESSQPDSANGGAGGEEKPSPHPTMPAPRLGWQSDTGFLLSFSGNPKDFAFPGVFPALADTTWGSCCPPRGSPEDADVDKQELGRILQTQPPAYLLN